jgi:hypothetical protein
MTASQRRVIACSATTFAPVPLKTGKASACDPKWSLTASASLAVVASSPYATSCPAFARAIASITSGCTEA